MKTERSLKAVPPASPNEKRQLEIAKEIELIKHGKRPIPPSAYTTKGEVLEHRIWPEEVIRAFAGEN